MRWGNLVWQRRESAASGVHVASLQAVAKHPDSRVAVWWPGGAAMEDQVRARAGPNQQRQQF